MFIRFYKRLVKIELEKMVGKENAGKLIKVYEDDFALFLEYNWSPSTAALAIVMGF